MRLLVVAEDVPNRHPRAGDGSSLISYELLQHLPPDIAIDLLTFDRGTSVPPEVVERCSSVELLPVRRPAVAVLRALVTRRHPAAHAREAPQNRRRIRELSTAADVTLLHGPHVLHLAHQVVGPVLAQSVDPWSQRTVLEATFRPQPLAALLRLRARLALSAERRLPRHVRLLTVGAKDAETWSRMLGRDVRAVPNGAMTPGPGLRRVQRAPSAPPVACFVGSLDYAPNIDSAQRLVRQVLPLIRAQVPELEVRIVGRRPVPAVQALVGRGVRVLPDVPSVIDELLSADVAVFADRHGLGVRNSVQESLTAGLPVVATSVAARGIAEHSRLLIADDDTALAAAVVRVLRDPLLAPCEPSAPRRTWNDAAGDYVRELRCLAAASA